MAGRGKLRQALQSLDDASSDSNASPSTTHDSGIASGRGRYKLLSSIRTGDSAYEASSSAASTPRRSKLLGKLIEPAESVDDLAQIKSKIETLTTELSKCLDIDRPEPGDAAATEAALIRQRGTSGNKIGILSNFIRLRVDRDKGVFEYIVQFEPSVHSPSLRFQLLNQHRDIIGQTKTFDGMGLYLPFKLPNEVTMLRSKSAHDNSEYTLKITFKQQQKYSECTKLYGILFDRVMKILKFVRFKTKNFDPTAPKVIPQHKLEIFPGYVTAVDEYDDGVMLCIDVTHQVLRTTTVLDTMTHAFHSSRGDVTTFRKTILTALLGSIVLTRYNNKTYRIDDIDFNANPSSKFKTKDSEISYYDYYRKQYNIEIRDLKQPLLISRKAVRVSGEAEKQEWTFCLVPEICLLTGLTDLQRTDMKVLRDVATITRITPNQRVFALEQYCKRVNETPEAKAVLSGWGLTLEDKPFKIDARQLKEEQILFAKNKSFPAGKMGDFSRYSTNNELLEVVHLRNWLIIHTERDVKIAKSFTEHMQMISKPMGIHVIAPKVVSLRDDKTETYITALKANITAETQIVVTICPTSRDDRYASIKKICCSEIPVPSQVINARTLSNEAKNRSVVQKIALQMNCKLGGSLWSVNIPLKNAMICGIDTFHETTKKTNSVSALVASYDASFTRWYSRSIIQTNNEEPIHGLVQALHDAIVHYQKVNDDLPQRIIIYRDGIGDGQLKMCRDYEVVQIKNAMKLIDPGYMPDITMIVVQKRVNTRLFAISPKGEAENPSPGCIIDHTITRRSLFDFYVVPQAVRQGTVSPTHYVVVYDSAKFEADVIQRLTYKMCFMYYNWPGTVRVPACCQYAHKLAFLIGQSVKRNADEKLADKLFFL